MHPIAPIALLLAALAPATMAATPLDDLLACNARVAGPRMASAPPQRLEFHLEIEEPTFQVEGIYRATRDGRMRIDVFAGDTRVFAEALDGQHAYQWRPDAGVTRVGAAAAAALRHGIELPGRFFTFAAMEARGHRVEDLGLARERGRELRVLEVTLDDGHRKRYWLDAATCREVRNRDVRAFHPDIDATEVTIESRPSEVRLVDGLAVAFRSEQWNVDDDEWLGTTTVKRVVVDGDLSGVAFDLADLAYSTDEGRGAAADSED